jgi:Ca2+-binding RTX toxin-like protein
VDIGAFEAPGPETINLTAGNGDAEISTQGGQIVVSQGGVVLFSGDPASLTSLTVNGSTDDDVIGVTGPLAADNADFDLTIDGGDGTDEISFLPGPIDIGAGNLNATGESIILGTDMTTTGSQTFTGAVILEVDTALTGTTITFGSTIDSESGETNALSITGNAGFGSEIGDTDLLSMLSVSGSASLNGERIATTGTQTFTGAVILEDEAELTGSTITFGSTVDSESGETNSLGITGSADFGGAVDSTDNLSTLSVSGTTIIDGGSIETTGTQTLTGAVLIGADTTLTGSTVSFGSNQDSDGAVGEFDLTVTGNASFAGQVGGSDSVAALSVSGTTTIDTDLISTSGDQTFSGPVILAAPTTALSGPAVTFDSTVDSESGENNDLDIDTDNSTTFNGVVGGNDALSDLNVGLSPTSINASITTTDDQVFDGPVTIDGTYSPNGAGIGQPQVDNDLTLAGTAVLTIDLDGTTPGTQHDQIRVTGAGRTVSLGNAMLDVDLGFTPQPNTEFVIVDLVDAGSAISGTFAGLPEGAFALFDGELFTITYQGGDGNDVALLNGVDVIVEVDGDGNLAIRDVTGKDNAIIAGFDPMTNELVVRVTTDGGPVQETRIPRGDVTGILTADLGAGNDQLNLSNPGDAALQGLPFGSIVVGGGTDSDTLLGGFGNDTLRGDLGNERLRGGRDNDFLNGGADDDDLGGEDGNDTANGGSGADTLTGGAGNDLLGGGTGDDDLSGDAGSDTLDGAEGNDTLSGGTDSDTLLGGFGSDTLQGNEGDDRLAGGRDNDFLNGGVGADDILGEAGNDTALGGDGNDTVVGGDGNDLIRGGDGQDLINGLAGNDSLFGEAGSDALYGFVGNDELSGGSGGDALHGGFGDDTLFGNDGKDRLFGGRGDDVLSGGELRDTLNGGSDSDQILFDITDSLMIDGLDSLMLV